MSHPQLPLVLRKDDHLVVAVYDESAATLTELSGESTNRYTGDYRECDVCFNPMQPTMFAHASTTHLRCSELHATTSGPVSTTLRFEHAMPHVVIALMFSPRGTYLVSYATMDPKRTPEGNLSVFEVATGALVLRTMQVRWPAMGWTIDEAFLVRPMQGQLQVLQGHLGNGATAAGEAATAPPPSPANSTSALVCLSRTDLLLAQDKEIEFSTSPREGLPILALFKPFHKQQQASLSLYRLPNLHEGALFQVPFGRSESARILWSCGGQHLALLVQSERDASGKSYYGTTALHLIDVLKRSIVTVKLTGDGETVHDAQWSPTTSDVLLVVHGKMPRNKVTLYSKNGLKLLSLGEAPRNMALWAPNASGFVLGGSGNLAGDYVFYTYAMETISKAALEAEPRRLTTRGPAEPTTATLPTATGELNEKCSYQSWAPDSHHFLCATLFTRLRMDNKVVIVKNNGMRVVTVRYPTLFEAHWVQAAESYVPRPASPRPAEQNAQAKPQVYCPPGGTSTRAAALLRRGDASTAGSAAVATPVGPVGATLVPKKKKKR